MTEHLTVPLVVPTRSQLRAGALWVEFANWADGLADRYGASIIVTATGTLSAERVRALAWANGSAIAVNHDRGQRFPHLRTLAKDFRGALRAVRFRRRIGSVEMGRAPYVWQHHDLFQTAGFRLARRLGVPLVLFVDAPQVWEAERWGVRRPGWSRVLQQWGEVPQLRHADVVACVSREVAEQVVDLGASRARVVVTPCTADPDRLGRAPSARPRIAPSDRIVVGWVGSFRRFHHADLLVRATARAQRLVPAISLLMVGDGPTRAACERLARELGLQARFTGAVPNAEVPSYVKALDVAIVTADGAASFHYSPLKLKEYLALERATVVPRIGEMQRTLRSGEDALFYEPGDEAGLAAQIAQLAADPDLRARIAAAGHRHCRAQFSMENNLQAIDEALATSRSGRSSPLSHVGLAAVAQNGHGHGVRTAAVRRGHVLVPTGYASTFNMARVSRHEMVRTNLVGRQRRLWRPLEAIAVWRPGIRFDVLHSFNRIPLLPTRPWMVSFEDFLPRTGGSRGADILRATLRERLVDSDCRHIIAISHYALGVFRRQCDGWANGEGALGKTRVMWPNLPARARHPKRYRPGERLDAVFVARDWGFRGGVAAVRLAEQARHLRLPLHLHVVSTLRAGYADDPDRTRYWQDLRRLDACNVTHHVELTNDAVHALLARSHLALLPTVADTFGFVILEALANAVPALVSNVGALPELIQDGVNGRVVSIATDDFHDWVHVRKKSWEYLDPTFSAMARAATDFVEELVTGRIDYERLSAGALQRVVEHHDPFAAAAVLDRLYDDMLDS